MTKPKMGRPTKEEALIKAIEAFGGAGIDYELVDPRNIVAAIAADPAVSAPIRLRACVILMSKQMSSYTIGRKFESARRSMEESARARSEAYQEREAEQAAA